MSNMPSADAENPFSRVTPRGRVMAWVILGFLAIGTIVLPIFVLCLAFSPGTLAYARWSLTAAAILLLAIGGRLAYAPVRRRMRTGTWKVSAQERRELAAQHDPASLRRTLAVTEFLLPAVWLGVALVWIHRAMTTPHSAYNIAYACFWTALGGFQVWSAWKRRRSVAKV